MTIPRPADDAHKERRRNGIEAIVSLAKAVQDCQSCQVTYNMAGAPAVLQQEKSNLHHPPLRGSKPGPENEHAAEFSCKHQIKDTVRW